MRAAEHIMTLDASFCIHARDLGPIGEGFCGRKSRIQVFAIRVIGFFRTVANIVLKKDKSGKRLHTMTLRCPSRKGRTIPEGIGRMFTVKVVRSLDEVETVVNNIERQ